MMYVQVTVGKVADLSVITKRKHANVVTQIAHCSPIDAQNTSL
jgi:ABC-type transporter Mla subunit MlaD